MYKLLMRAFPGWYRPNSVYALFPFSIPEQNRAVLTKRGTVEGYSFEKPSFVGPPSPIFTWQGVVNVLNDQKRFKVPCESAPKPIFSIIRVTDFDQGGPHTLQLTKHDYMLSGDSQANNQQRNFVSKCMFEPKEALDEVRNFYEAVTLEFLHKFSKKARSIYQVDAVRE